MQICHILADDDLIKLTSFQGLSRTENQLRTRFIDLLGHKATERHTVQGDLNQAVTKVDDLAVI